MLTNFKKFSSGFSIVEVMVVIAILAVIASFIGPIYRATQTKNNLSIATTSIAQAFRRAQSQSQAVKLDSNWGTEILSNKVVVFKGPSYAGSVASYDDAVNFPVGVSASGLSEVVFAKLTGWPQVTGTTTITSANDLKQININAKGAINY